METFFQGGCLRPRRRSFSDDGLFWTASPVFQEWHVKLSDHFLSRAAATNSVWHCNLLAQHFLLCDLGGLIPPLPSTVHTRAHHRLSLSPHTHARSLSLQFIGLKKKCPILWGSGGDASVGNKTFTTAVTDYLFTLVSKSVKMYLTMKVLFQ